MNKKRFYVKAQPLGYSTGYYYELIDVENELTDLSGNYLFFKYEDDADNICDFLNKQNKRIEELEIINNGLNYALKYIKKIDVEIDLDDRK